MKKLISLITFIFFSNIVFCSDSIQNKEITDSVNDGKTIVYKLDIKQEIGPAIWRQTQQAFSEAQKVNADLILIHMNTYGGMLLSADSIRTKILNSKIPVYVFIDNNAASAGALISIACDRIYMRKGANIGAATVVNQQGEPQPDKYQSYMRSMMRATAESHGKDTIISGNDTSYVWKRDPHIAEAMVDPSLSVEGVSDSSKVLTFTTSEAIRFGFCEGQAETIPDVMKIAGVQDYEIKEYKPTTLEKIIGFLVNPVLQSIFIMIIIGGLYFELQSPGVGFPLAASVVAALFYFAPLYLEGIAENWEIIVFVVGVLLLAVEIFAIPGFGVAGISGIILIVSGLALAMIDNIGFSFEFTFLGRFFKAIVIVVVSMVVSVIISLYLTKKAFKVRSLSFLALDTSQNKQEGYIGVTNYQDTLTGKTGVAVTVLRPSGKVEIEDEIYDARALTGYIEKGTDVKIIKYESGQVYVKKITN